MYAYIAFPIANYQQFIYLIPSHLTSNIKEGICVEAPFRNKVELGFIVSITNKTSFKNKIKSIKSIGDKNIQLPLELWKTIKWISNYYICPIGIVLKTAVPLLFKKDYIPKEKIYLKITQEGKDIIPTWGEKAPKQFEFLSILLNEDGPVPLNQISSHISSSSQIYKKLLEKKLLSIVPEEEFNQYASSYQSRDIILSKDQHKIFNIIKPSINGNKYAPYLLHGITGSGKTEIYIKLAFEVIKQKKTMLMLVPEISLTPQLSQKFIQTFGEKIGLWHSKLTKREKHKTWTNIKNKKYSIIIGARSAIFSPLSNLGLIIIDEEHDSSYKQESSSFKYHARDVALVRAKYSNKPIVLGSATPSIESYYYAINKKTKLLNLNTRYNDVSYPEVKIVDMKTGSNRFSYDFSHELIKSMKECINKKEQIIILHNRRGFSNICRCQDCGVVVSCQNCSISLTYHSADKLICHYCSGEYSRPSECDECNGNKIEFIGTGTQKIELELKNFFPDIEIARMDFDTMKNYKNYEKILKDFSDHKYDILLGTQMVSKGLDFKGVTLVGVINGDTSLYIPDFRSGERAFQLLYQVSGRAGRNEKPGKAIIQTWSPDNIFINSATELNMDNYYQVSLKHREELNYPPFSKLLRILISSKNKSTAEKTAQKIKQKLDNHSNSWIILGPSIAPIEKIKNNWRFHILIKFDKSDLANIYDYISKEIGFNTFYKKNKYIKLEIEVDPISIL